MNYLFFILIVFAGAVLFSVCAGFFTFQSIFLRKPETTQSFEKDMPGINEKLTAHTRDPKIMDIIHKEKRAWLERQVKKHVIYADDGVELAGYISFAQNGQKSIKTVAVLIHGFMDSAAGLAYLSKEYNERGIHTLSIDCRAHGKSGGKKVGMGYKDAYDLVHWIDFALEQFGEQTRFILHGISMGAVTVYQYSGLKKAKKQSAYINVMVADCGFSSYSEQMRNQIKLIMGGFWQIIPRNLIIFGGSLICAITNGFFFFQNSPQQSVKKRKKNGFEHVPLIIFHGQNDVLVPPYMAQTIYNCANGVKKIILVPNAPHIGSYFYDTKKYFYDIMHSIGGE